MMVFVIAELLARRILTHPSLPSSFSCSMSLSVWVRFIGLDSLVRFRYFMIYCLLILIKVYRFVLFDVGSSLENANHADALFTSLVFMKLWPKPFSTNCLSISISAAESNSFLSTLISL